LQRSFLQQDILNLVIKKPRRSGAFLINRHNSFRKTILPVTDLE
jgi:hypothetical protein